MLALSPLGESVALAMDSRKHTTGDVARRGHLSAQARGSPAYSTFCSRRGCAKVVRSGPEFLPTAGGGRELLQCWRFRGRALRDNGTVQGVEEAGPRRGTQCFPGPRAAECPPAPSPWWVHELAALLELADLRAAEAGGRDAGPLCWRPVQGEDTGPALCCLGGNLCVC